MTGASSITGVAGTGFVESEEVSGTAAGTGVGPSGVDSFLGAPGRSAGFEASCGIDGSIAGGAFAVAGAAIAGVTGGLGVCATAGFVVTGAGAVAVCTGLATGG